MVFYDLLPNELWFKIYKIEHNLNLVKIHEELTQLNKDKELINKNIILAIRFRNHRLNNLLFILNKINMKNNNIFKIPIYDRQLKIKKDIENKKLYNYYEFWNLKEFQKLKILGDKFSEIKFQLDEIKWYGFHLFL